MTDERRRSSCVGSRPAAGGERPLLASIGDAGARPPARRDTFGAHIYSDFNLALLRSLGVGSRPRRLKRPEEVLGVVR